MASRMKDVLREGDAEIDGESPNDKIGCVMSRGNFSVIERLAKVDPNSNKNFDSGNFSYSLSSQTSLEIPLKQEGDLLVECSDITDLSPHVTALEKKLGDMTVHDTDEGVLSYESEQCLERVGSSCESSDALEVDLFEQNIDGDNIIHLAILRDMPMLASMLINIVEDVDCLDLQNSWFQTPLHLAIIVEHYDIAVQLVKKGADVKRCDRRGNTPLHIACRKGAKDVIKALLKTFGKNEQTLQEYFAMKNCYGLTCLHLAAEQNHFLIMGYLFAKGADVNMGDAKSGRTILHYAVEKRDVDTVALLLTHPEINAECKTYKGETPLVLAFWRNYQEIVKRLKNNGAYFDYDIFSESDDDVM